MNIRAALVAAGLVVFSTSAAEAHHSFSAMYDAAKPVRLVGKLTKIEWTNPHSYFYIGVTDSKGVTTNWACEGAGPGALSRRGFQKGDIKFGDSIIIDGYLSKNGAKIVDARRVTLPDGRVVNGGTPGDGGPGDPTRAGRPG
ncbi:MAG: hypothetical protein EON61_06905 [Alphaproteobacteria bacterium]|nr:MAG: hypothetical protein EON61_06905 [Alphaproteobacteria bacterium]